MGVINVSAPADASGITVLAASARSAVESLGGDGDSVGLVVRQLGDDARVRLQGGEEDSTLALTAEVKGTEFLVTLRDFGEPIVGAPEAILLLLEAGLATSADARTDGLANLTEVRFALPSHNQMLDTDSLEILPDDSEPSTEEVTLRELRIEDAAALTRTLYRCYGWSYPLHAMYYPERIAAAIASGERIGQVAVSDSGEIAAHWGAVYLSDSVVETGGTVTDPRFRRRGLANQLGERLLEQLNDLGVTGRVREPVMTHTATQEIAIREGATMVGVYLGYTAPMQQVGITHGMQSTRNSLSVAYGALKPLSPASMWIPRPYEPMARIVLGASSWPRTLEAAQSDVICPDRTVLSTAYDSGNLLGVVDVTVVGKDLVDEVDSALDQLKRAGAEYVQVRLPVNQPALGTYAAGLTELGLSFGALIPQFRTSLGGDIGDVLITQWLADLSFDVSEWVFANDDVKNLVESVVAQARDVSNRGTQRQRRAARRAQLFAALDDF